METVSCHANSKIFSQTVSYFAKQQLTLTSNKLFWQIVSKFDKQEAM